MTAREAWRRMLAADERCRSARGTTAFARAEEAAQRARRQFSSALSRCR